MDEVLYGFGKILNGPTPANIETDARAEGNTEGQAILIKAGWKENKDGILKKDKIRNINF